MGKYAVSLFFCMTAFLFVGRGLDTKGEIGLKEFARGRLMRIAPAYLLSVLIALLAVSTLVDWTTPTTWKDVGSMLLLGVREWGALDDVWMRPLNSSVEWTLKYEWMFYAFVIPMAWMVRRGTLVGAALVLGGLFLLGNKYYILMFQIGAASAWIVRYLKWNEFLRGEVATLAVVVSAGLLLTAGYVPKVSLLVAVVFLPVAAGNTLWGLLTWPGLQLMGLASYSVYLLHGFVLSFGQYWFRFSNPDWSPLRFWAVISGLGILTLVVSLCSFFLVEKPFMDWDKALRKRSRERLREKSPAVAGAAGVVPGDIVAEPEAGRGGQLKPVPEV